MLIILCLYIALIWLIFSRLKLIRWGWGSGTVTVLIGAFILAVFLALFNHLTPSGSVIVASRVVEVIPNVSGQIISVPVKTNVPIKTGDVLFKIDPVPFENKVRQLEASLAQAQDQAKQLVSNYEQATANVQGLTAQVAYNRQRLADMQKLTSQQAQSEFKLQDTQSQYDTANYQFQAAKAAQTTAKLAMDSQVSGVNTAVAQIQAQLDQAKWELEQTTVRAPDDGYVTSLALAVGDRALQARAVMSLVVSRDIRIIGMFSPNGFETVRPGAPAKIVFDNRPGQIFSAEVVDIPIGVGQGQIAVSGMLVRSGSMRGADSYPAVISIPKGYDKADLRLGMPGTATVFAPNAGVIGIIKNILVWISSYTAYL
ncbi:biotin/lipoyl-binding protein [Bradyrhizobium sp. UFLA01-814]|uniref:HlyD family secretion protein n=1 Tax=Bradyrhizobium sp. UFLA01-814 TaxID=3023480 RepID=UPI00398A945F